MPRVLIQMRRMSLSAMIPGMAAPDLPPTPASKTPPLPLMPSPGKALRSGHMFSGRMSKSKILQGCCDLCMCCLE